MKPKPWFKFYTQDWLGDHRLNNCSPAAHGLLIRLMAFAHNAEPYGFIRDKYGPITADMVAQMRSWPHQTVTKAWAELEHEGRIARACYEHEVSMIEASTEQWYIPRMVADHAYLLQQSELGKTGGNPTLKGCLKPEAEQSKKQIRKEAERAFASFWNEYPRKVGKKAALKAYMKVPATERANILSALRLHKHSEQWQKDGGKFVPYPATWLNGERWDDVLEPATKTKAGPNI
jgi:hypothetical protein